MKSRKYPRWRPLGKSHARVLSGISIPPISHSDPRIRAVCGARFSIGTGYIPKAMLLPGLLIRSRMIHRAHYRGRGAHRRNNANKPITSILRNRRARQRRCGEGLARRTRGKEGSLPKQGDEGGGRGNGECIVRLRAATGSERGQHAARMHARCIR